MMTFAARRGRPPKKEKMVPLIVMVRPVVKQWIQRTAAARGTTLSEETRQVLDNWYEMR